jgi:hypothetical protein
MKPIFFWMKACRLNLLLMRDADLEDNICLKIIESCIEEKRIFKHDKAICISQALRRRLWLTRCSKPWRRAKDLKNRT